MNQPYGSPSLASSLGQTQWRYTPPPTTSAVRSNKRKCELLPSSAPHVLNLSRPMIVDDRFDPYPTSSKRRAVSPSISQLGRVANGVRHPLPITIPNSAVSSAASSPTISYAASGLSLSRPVSISSSPTLRASMGASPISRHIPRTRRGDGEEKEIEGAGEAVGGLSIA